MSEKSQYLGIGSPVRTLESRTLDSEWSPEARKQRKWGVTGIITDYSNGHGLCFKVEYSDGSAGWFDLEELALQEGARKR